MVNARRALTVFLRYTRVRRLRACKRGGNHQEAEDMAECNLTIGVFGRRRAGKSCLVRCLGGKAAPPAGPGVTEEVCVDLPGIGRACVVLPAGLDDERALGVDADRASEIVERVDIALVVIDAALGWSDYERFLLSRVRFAGDSVIVLVNRAAGQNVSPLLKKLESFGMPVVEADLSSEADAGRIIAAVREEVHRRDGDPNLLEGLLGKGESVWVVVPVSRPSYVGPVGPPEERLARDAVRSGISVCVLKEAEFLERWASGQGRPRLVVSDAAVFGAVEQAVNGAVPVTTLSLLIARQRGELVAFVRGAQAISRLSPGGRVLIAESCDLHVQPDDAGRAEIPNLLRRWVGGDLEFATSSGANLLESISGYDLVVRCGACMQDREHAQESLRIAASQNVPITNYGIALAYMHGVLGAMVRPFVEAGEMAAPEVDLSRAIPLALHDEYCSPPGM